MDMSDDSTPSDDIQQATDQALLASARQAGFAVLSAPVSVDPAAARLLPDDTGVIATAAAGGVLQVVSDHVPSPAEFNELSKLSGMLVTVSVAPSQVFRQVAMQAAPAEGEPPRSIGPALAEAVARGASDVHLSVGAPPVLRVAGELVELDPWPPLSSRDLDAAARWVAGDHMDTFTGDFDCAVSYAGGRWRVSVYRQRQALAMALRLIPSTPPASEDLSLPAAVVALSKETQGLVLFVGPTGSGKSTTQASLLDRINRTRSCHIVTVEDPVEYLHPSKRAVVHQREVGDDTESFATGLRHVLRQDPDVILVGEMRDPETMATALTAAETGHLVFATVHATDAASTFNRIIDAFPAAQQPQIRTQLAQSLRAVVIQLLLPRCDDPAKRQLVCEVVIMNPAVRTIVREDRLHELTSAMDSAASTGMCTMERALAEQVMAGHIDMDLARSWSREQASFDAHLARMSGPRTRVSFDDFDAPGVT
jgi:twitching motility protein PilT